MLSAQELNVEDLLSKTEDADMAKTMVTYSRQQTAYQAALQAGAQDHPADPDGLPAVHERHREAHVKIESTRFGTIEMPDDTIVLVPDQG